MKRSVTTLTLTSLILGALITLGLTRYVASGHINKVEACNDRSVNFMLDNLNRPIFCNTWQRGYPLQFLDSQISGEVFNGTQAGKTAGIIWSNPWIEFKPATADWLIWSVVSAVGIGTLVYFLERAGFTTGFADKKKHRR